MNKGVTFREGTVGDSFAVMTVIEIALHDLLRRMGMPAREITDEKLAQQWAARGPIFEHLARTSEHFWLAELDGEIVGVSRSIMRDGIRQLTELFVLPEAQSGGTGRELVRRAFPQDGARGKSIIATTDGRAQTLYVKNGVRPDFLLYYFGRTPEDVPYETDLTIETFTPETINLDALAAIDREIIGFTRPEDHRWLSGDRQGYLYSRSGKVVGYGYAGEVSGPFALLNADDYPAVLSHAESAAASAGQARFGMEVPMINRMAVDHFVARGYQMDSFTAVAMKDSPFGQYDKYIVTSPPFFL